MSGMSRLSLRFLAACLASAGAAGAQPAAEAPPVKLAEVVVAPSRFGVTEERVTVTAALTSAELETLPQIGDDLYRSIARLPGLAVDDFSARFWVRGAPNREVLARFDGVELTEPFHLKDIDGALSIVDPQVISRLDLATGGLPVDQGNRLAGALTLESKVPAKRLVALGLSLSGVGAMGQGRTADGKGAWLAAARRGYPDLALRAAGRDDEIDPRYYDAYAKFEYRIAPAHTVSVHALHAGDALRYRRTNDPDLDSAYASSYLWLRWRAELPGGPTGETVLSVSRLEWERTGGGRNDGFPFALRDDRRLDAAALRQEWTWPLAERALVRAGFEAKTGEMRYDYTLARQQTIVAGGRQVTVPIAARTNLRPEGDYAAAFVAGRVRVLPVLVLEPGLRYDRQDFTRDKDWSPRINAVLNLGRTTLRAAWGAYAQAQGLHELAVPDGETVYRRSEQAEQKVLGFERPLGGGLALRVEGYERTSWRLRPRWENLDNGYDLFPEVQDDRARLAPSRGRARGVEVLVSGRPGGKLTWNASYAWSKTEERLGARWVPRARDQTHTLHGTATYAPNPRWQFSAAFQYHTGWPTTDVVYSLAPLTNGRRVLVSANGVPYNLALPDYHRLDLRATRRFVLKRGELRCFLDLYNVYDRTNYVGYLHRISINGTEIRDRREPRDQLPFLPSVGLAWEF